MQCRWQVEIDPYCQRVLARHWPDCGRWDDVRTFDGRPWRGIVDVISGGFPCQDISAAGSGAGIDGERSGLWSEFARIIGEVGPRYVLVENSPMLTSRGLGRVLGDLAALGYDARWCVLGAIDAGAPHERERIWILATVADAVPSGERRDERQGQDEGDAVGASDVPDTMHDRQRLTVQHVAGSGGSSSNVGRDGAVRHVADAASELAHGSRQRSEPEGQREPTDGGENAPDANGAGRIKQRRAKPAEPQQPAAERGSWWRSEPDVGRVANGVASRVDRVRCLGNGQVPAVAALAWRIMRE